MNLKDSAEIRRLALFREMAEENFQALMRGTYCQLFPPRVSIVEEGDPAQFLPVLMMGAVELRARWEGREAAICLVEPVAAVLPAATMPAGPYPMTGTTLTKSRIALIPSEDVRRISAADLCGGSRIRSGPDHRTRPGFPERHLPDQGAEAPGLARAGCQLPSPPERGRRRGGVRPAGRETPAGLAARHDARKPVARFCKPAGAWRNGRGRACPPFCTG